jgi:hypothetical protein
VTNLLIAFIVILVIKFVINLSRYINCQRYFSHYDDFLKHPSWKIQEDSMQIVKLFKEAGVEDSLVTHVEELG